MLFLKNENAIGLEYPPDKPEKILKQKTKKGKSGSADQTDCLPGAAAACALG